MDRIRVVLADDHPVFRHGLRAILSTTPDTEVVGEASTGEQAVEVAIAHDPDVVVMDLTMPGLNGVEATRAILAERPGANVLVVTMFDDARSVLAAVRAGARGYILKGADGEDVLRAIRAAAHGEAIFSPTAAQRLTQHLTARAAPRPADPAFPELTDREREILELVAEGYTNTTIAERCSVSPKTVRNHVSNILTKLGLDSRAEAIARVRDTRDPRRSSERS
jgi:DNA-binding NarL/FixJ family response regulator